MSSLKESNTSKTAHVMNLLSRSRSAPAPAAPQEETAEAAAPPVPETAAAAAPAVAPASQTPPIIASMQHDHEIATSIKDALEATLAQELAQSDPEPDQPHAPPAPPAPPEEEQAAPAQPSAAEQAPAPISPDGPSDDPAVPPPETAEPAPQDSPSVPPAEQPSAPADAVEDSRRVVNVMEQLVEERVDKYIKLFGLCDCPQCRRDVTALALNELPSKYVVMPQNAISARLAIYGGRFSTALTAQILRACKQVLEHPRHEPI